MDKNAQIESVIVELQFKMKKNKDYWYFCKKKMQRHGKIITNINKIKNV